MSAAFHPAPVHRSNPRDAIGAIARGVAAAALGRRLLELSDEHLERLSGVAGRGVIAVLGSAVDLPWVDGITYLGRVDDGGGVLLPTVTGVSIHEDLFTRAVIARGVGSLVAVTFDPPRIVDLSSAKPIDRAQLEAWVRETD